MKAPDSGKEAQLSIDQICAFLAAEGYSLKLRTFSAIDKYLRMPALPYIWAETSANIAVLAKFIENLRFPGMEIADGAVDLSDATLYFRCTDGSEQNSRSFPLLSLLYDWQSGHFQDPLGIYPLIRRLHTTLEDASLAESAAAANTDRYRLIMDSSLFLARYPIETGTRRQQEAFFEAIESCGAGLQPGNYDARLRPMGVRPCPEKQRAFLSCLLVSPWPHRGFHVLKRTGFLEEFWPELSGLDNVDHSKEFHPEGNVWNHTMETFRHRKALGSGAFDLRLSLGLLLHDAGKPIAASSGSRRFDGHAELGAAAASRFLERLGFGPSLSEDVFYLVKNHMLPAALKRLPVAKTRKIMTSPVFPTLMELYRCDESSSFKGLDDFYENSAAYQNYLKNLRNPYRSDDGKKTGKKNIRQ